MFSDSYPVRQIFASRITYVIFQALHIWFLKETKGMFNLLAHLQILKTNLVIVLFMMGRIMPPPCLLLPMIISNLLIILQYLLKVHFE